LNNTAAENITFDGSTSVTLNSNAVNSGNSICFENGGTASFPLAQQIDLNTKK